VVNAAYTAYLLNKNKSWSQGAAADRRATCSASSQWA